MLFNLCLTLNLGHTINELVLRGGSWFNDKEGWLRCASRLRHYPDGENDSIGFQVAVSPFFTLDSEPSEL